MKPEAKLYPIGPLTVCATQRVVMAGSTILDLAPKTVSVLLLLVETPGSVVSREALREAVWGDAIVEEAVISRNISLLRSKLRPYLGGTEVIETISKRGYRFIPPDRHPNDEASTGAAGVEPTPPEEVPPVAAPQVAVAGAVGASGQTLLKRSPAVWIVSSVGALLLVASAIVFRSYLLPAPQPTVALLHIRDLSQESSTEWIGVMLETELRAQLTADRGVVSPDAALTFAAEHDLGPHTTINNAEARSLGQRLNARLLLTGNYLAANGQVRVDLSLRDAATGDVVDRWTATMPEPQLHQLSQEAAAHLRSVLRLKPLSHPVAQPFFTVSQVAAKQYAEAMAISQSSDNGTGAAELLRNAVRADPGFAQAHAALSVVLTRLGEGQAGDDEARLALATASTLPLTERLLCQATAYAQLADYPRAVAALTDLHHRYPSDHDYTLRLSEQLANFGKLDQASDLLLPLEQAGQSGPLDARVSLALAQVANLRGDLKGVALYAGQALARGMADGSRAEQAQALEISGEAWTKLRDCDHTHTELNQASALFTAMEDRENIVLNLLAQAYAAQVCGEPSARSTTQAAMAAAKALNRKYLIARAYKMQGIVQIAHGQDEDAVRSYKQAIQLAGAVHDWNTQLLALNDLGIAELGTLQIDAAFQHTQQALDIARLTGSTMGIARSTLQLADLEAGRGKTDFAIGHYRQGIGIMSQLGQMMDVNDRRFDIGDLLLVEGKLDEAEATFQTIDVKTLSVSNLSTLKTDRARILAARGDVPSAESLARDAADGATSPDHKIESLDLLADLQLRSQDLRGARMTLAEMSQLVKLVPTDRDSVHLVTLLGARLNLAQGDTGRAEHALSDLLRDAIHCHDKELEMRVKIAQGQLAARIGRGIGALRAAVAEARQNSFVLLAEGTEVPAG